MSEIERVQSFVYYEAQLLDEKNFDEWLALLTDDVLYWMPLKRDQAEEDIYNSLLYEDKLLLQVRIERLKSPRVFSQLPPSHCQHVLQHPEVICQGDKEYQSRTPFIYLESHMDTQITLGGVVHHELVNVDGELRIRRKRIELLNRESALPSIQLFL